MKIVKGYPTDTVDINGKRIRLGDKVTYDFKGDTSVFTVVFVDNAFRKMYKGWDKTLEMPILECGNAAIQMRLKVIDNG